MKTSILKGTFFLTVASGVFMVSGYILNVFLGKFLGPVDYGRYGVIVSLISIINVIQTSGITQSISKHVSEEGSDKDSLIRSGIILQGILNIVFLLLFLLFSSSLSKLLNDHSLSNYLKLSAFVFPSYGFYALFFDFNNGLHHFKKQAFMYILYSLSKFFFVLILGIIFKIPGIIIGLIIAPLIPLSIGFKLPKKGTRIYPFKKILDYSYPLIGLAIFSNLLLSMDLLLIKSLIPIKEYAGYYTASQSISKILFFGMNPFSLVIFPTISRIISTKNHQLLNKVMKNSLRISFLIIFPLSLLISNTSQPLIRFIYSTHYLPAAASLSILVFGVGAFTLFTNITYILSAAGKPYMSSLLSFVGLIISFAFGITLIPKFSLEGAAIATTIGSSIAFALASLYIFKTFQAHIPLKSIFKIILCSFLALTVVNIFPSNSWVLIIKYFLFAVIYSLLLILIKEINIKDTNLIKNYYANEGELR